MAKSNVGKKPISEEEYTTNKVLTAVVLFAPAHMLVVMGAAAAYLFVTAVYYTVKLM